MNKITQTLSEKLKLESDFLQHDLNNMFNLINGSAEMIEYLIENSNLNYDDKKQSLHYLQNIQKGSKNVSFFLLNFIDYIVSSHDMQIESISYFEFCKTFDKYFKTYSDIKKVPSKSFIISDPKERNPIILKNDPYLFRSIVNLVQNSKEANANSIKLEQRLIKNFVISKISDDGIGMPEEVLSKCLDKDFTTKSLGTGLGLSSVNYYLKKIGGHLKIKSKINEGTQVILYHPISK